MSVLLNLTPDHFDRYAGMEDYIRAKARIFMNLSGTSLSDPSLLAHIERRVRESGVAPGRLVFEVTETAGHHAITWDGRADSGQRAGPGVYLANLVVEKEGYQRRIPLLR